MSLGGGAVDRAGTPYRIAFRPNSAALVRRVLRLSVELCDGHRIYEGYLTEAQVIALSGKAGVALVELPGLPEGACLY